MNQRPIAIVSVEKLANGLYLAQSSSGLRGLYSADGTAYSGDLSTIVRRIRVPR